MTKPQRIGWMWYPCDMEIYHSMLQNFSREERGCGWPAYWHMDDWNKNVLFSRSYELMEETTFVFHATGIGYVLVNGRKYPLNHPVKCGPGKVDVSALVGNMMGLPAAFVEGEIICSDTEWRANNYMKEDKIGHSSLFAELFQNPNQVPYKLMICEPKFVKQAVSAQGNSGVLWDFGRMINGTLKLKLKEKNLITVCYGESDLEALDEEWCYYKQENASEDMELRRRSFRYLFIPGIREGETEITAVHTYVDIPVKAKFHCNDELLNRIFNVAVETFRQCSGMFFIDGIKRDRWVWSGDAYQSYLVNPYIFFDKEINKRTLTGLRGNLGITQHLNTIVDYSLLWIIGVLNEYEMTGDLEFVEGIFEKTEDLMQLCMRQTDEKGFIYGRPQDWIFIDWSDMDKEGTIAAEQVLLVKTYEVMASLCRLLEKDDSVYLKKGRSLKKNLMKYFWSKEKGAFIDSYESGRKHVTRHANIFAVLFDLVTEEQRQSIVKNVVLNPEITEITTPYFKFFELDMLCKLGYLDEVMSRMKSYWGGMLDRGAVTFWEEFDPIQNAPEQYSMYGDPFGKSLCHAWGASPIYLIGKYFLGVRPTSPGYETYEVKPELRFFEELDCTVPVAGGEVRILYRNDSLRVIASCPGGSMVVNGNRSKITIE